MMHNGLNMKRQGNTIEAIGSAGQIGTPIIKVEGICCFIFCFMYFFNCLITPKLGAFQCYQLAFSKPQKLRLTQKSRSCYYPVAGFFCVLSTNQASKYFA